MSIAVIILLVAFVNAFISLFTGQTQNLYCGIIGFSAPKKTKFDKNKLGVLFFINALLRGKDSVGYYTPVNGLKKVGKDYHTVATEENNIFEQLEPDNQLIGHVRAATIGVKNENNAHPWEFKNIVGLHNGTLRDYILPEYSIAKKYGFTHADYDVDSQVLLKALDRNFETLENNLLPALEEYEGAAALLMYNKSRETIFACHDDERPLFYGYVGKAMYISSIAHTLSIIGCKDIQEFEINHMHEIKDGQIINKFAYKPQSRIVKPVTSYVKGIKDRIDKENTVATSTLKGYYKLDAQGKLVASLSYPAAGLIYTGLYSLYAYDCDLFSEFNFRLRSNDKKVETIDLLTNETVTFNPDIDFFKIIETGEKSNVSGIHSIGSAITVFNISDGKTYKFKDHLIDVKRFIPTSGMYIKSVDNIVFTENNESFLDYGDVAEVLSFLPALGKFSVKNMNGKVARIDPTLFVLATSEEVSTAAFIAGNDSLYNEIEGIVPIVEDELPLGADSCAIKLTDPTEILPDEDDSLFDSTTAIINCDELDEFVDQIKDSLELISDMITEGEKMEDVHTSVKEAQSYINNYNFADIVIK